LTAERFRPAGGVVVPLSIGRRGRNGRPRSPPRLERSVDFPLTADDRPTLTGYQLRIPTYGIITASPLGGTLYLTFTDDSASRHDLDKRHAPTYSGVCTSERISE